MKIIDCFTFFNELDLLEIRLNSLAPYVDAFIIAEGDRTHAGNPKPMYFRENQERFMDFPIVYVPVTLPDDSRIGLQRLGPNWYRENCQREALYYGLSELNLRPIDIVLVSDLDEIPDLDGYCPSEGYFSQKLYYYYLNTYMSDDWHGTVAFKKETIDQIGTQQARELRWSIPCVGKGWHYSYLGDPKTKIQAFAHQELNVPANIDVLDERKQKLLDPFGRDATIQVVDLDGPEWLLQNRERYSQYIRT